MPEGTASLDHLPQDVGVLHGMIRELLATHHAQQRQIEQLTHRLDLLLKRVYGPRADQLDPCQLFLFEASPADSSPESVLLPEPDMLQISLIPKQACAEVAWRFGPALERGTERERRRPLLVDDALPGCR